MTIYWCEFPDKCNWKNIAEWLNNKKIIVYIACTSRADYEIQKSKINKFSKNIEVNAWPTLTKEEGYWFSGFSSKKSIDKLDQYQGLKIKIDIEPQILKGYNLFSAFYWMIINLLKKPKNNIYLEEKIKSLSKNTEIMISTFPLPKWILRRWGWIYLKQCKYNYMYYSTFFPKWLLPIYNFYYKYFFIKQSNHNFITIGLIGQGVFKNEPYYKNITEMKKDMKNIKNKKFIFFNLESISNRGKPWLDATLNY